jgi:hypothetical protein
MLLHPPSLFRDPVEFVVEITDAPDLKPWAERTTRA